MGCIPDAALRVSFRECYIEQHRTGDLDLSLSEAAPRRSFTQLSPVTDATLREMFQTGQVTLDAKDFERRLADRAAEMEELGVATVTPGPYHAVKVILQTNSELQALRAAQEAWEAELLAAMQGMSVGVDGSSAGAGVGS